MRRLELDIFYWSTRAAILLLLAPFISDIGLYEEYARNLVLSGKVPYIHWEFEYPPLAYPLMLIPGYLQHLLGVNQSEAYRVLFGLFLLPFDFLLYRGFRNVPPFRGAAFAYVLLTCAMGLLTFDRFDIVVGFMLAWPFLRKERNPGDVRAALSWGIGGALKLVPLFLVPMQLLGWEKITFSRLIRFGALAAFPILLSCAVVVQLTGGKISFLSHHSQRGVQIESLLASLVNFAQAFFHVSKVEISTNFGAQHLADIPGLVPLSRLLLWGSLLICYGVLLWKRRNWDTLSGSWMVISAFVTFGYVLSPQFLLWLIPIALCAASRVPVGIRRRLWLAIFSLAVILTGVHFRYYWDYVNLHHLATAMVLGRNLLLVLLWCLSWWWMEKEKKVEAPVLPQPGTSDLVR